jgi:hypothetical protein
MKSGRTRPPVVMFPTNFLRRGGVAAVPAPPLAPPWPAAAVPALEPAALPAVALLPAEGVPPLPALPPMPETDPALPLVAALPLRPASGVAAPAPPPRGTPPCAPPAPPAPEVASVPPVASMPATGGPTAPAFAALPATAAGPVLELSSLLQPGPASQLSRASRTRNVRFIQLPWHWRQVAISVSVRARRSMKDEQPSRSGKLSAFSVVAK